VDNWDVVHFESHSIDVVEPGQKMILIVLDTHHSLNLGGNYSGAIDKKQKRGSHKAVEMQDILEFRIVGLPPGEHIG
jgi:hypothetical protein